MIDTIKIFAIISKEIYNTIYSTGTVKTSFDNKNNITNYLYVGSNVEGSYSSNINIKIGNDGKYKTSECYIEIEGSYHKFIKGYNSHNGFYDLKNVSAGMIKAVENKYNICLPSIDNWYLQRVDIAICFDLYNQDNVITYINNLGLCSYPRRKIEFHRNESLYCAGVTSTLKIYNKLAEFKKHDYSKLKNTNFNIESYFKEISGFIRFECEIRKRLLNTYFGENYIRLTSVSYEDLKKIWRNEFMKLLKVSEDNYKMIKSKDDVLELLKNSFSNVKADNLYNFYLRIRVDGFDKVKNDICKSSFYQKVKDLKSVGIDISQNIYLYQDNRVEFNPFDYEEVI